MEGQSYILLLYVYYMRMSVRTPNTVIIIYSYRCHGIFTSISIFTSRTPRVNLITFEIRYDKKVQCCNSMISNHLSNVCLFQRSALQIQMVYFPHFHYIVEALHIPTHSFDTDRLCPPSIFSRRSHARPRDQKLSIFCSVPALEAVQRMAPREGLSAWSLFFFR